MRLSALNRKLLRELWELRGQVLAIAVVMAGGVMTWVIAYGTIDSIQTTQQAFYRENRFAEVFATLTRAPKSLAARVAEIPGVERVLTRVVAPANLRIEGFNEPVKGLVVSLPENEPNPLNALFLRSGRLPEPGADDEVVIGEPLAEAHGLLPGDTLDVIIRGHQERLRITGIGLSPEYIYQIGPGELFPDYRRYGVLWMNERGLARAMDMDGAFNDVSLTLAAGASERAVIRRLDQLLKRYGARGAIGRADQLSHNYLSQEFAQLRSMANIVPVIFLAVAAFLLSVVISRIVQNQRDLIGILKAFGYGNVAIGLHYVALTLLIVSIGVVIGLGLGGWLGRGLSSMYSDFFRFPYLHYRVAFGVGLSAAGFATLAGLTGTLRAVLQAVRLPPAEAMRPDAPLVYRSTLIERIGAQRWFDHPTRMILRRFERQPLKSGLSLLGIALSGGILFVGAFQEDAIDYILDVQFGLMQRQDMTVTFTEPVERAALYELAAIEGVKRVEPYRAVAVKLHAGHRSHRTAIQAFENGGELRAVFDDQLRLITLPPEGVVITDELADKLAINVGDALTVEVLEDTQPVREVRVAARVSEYIGLMAYMDIAALNRLMREGPVVSGAALSVDDRSQPRVLEELKRRPGIAGVSLREVSVQSFYDTMGETLLIFAFINTLLAGSIAFGVVYNSARIALAERSRELASLRVLGFTQGEVAWILLGELAILTLLAIPPGFLIGQGFCWLISHYLTSDLYRIPLVIEPDTYGHSALVVMASALLSAAVLGLRLRKLDLVGVLKTQE
jgi:putative ABC transport system permease protein